MECLPEYLLSEEWGEKRGRGLHFVFNVLLKQSTAVMPAFFSMSDKKREERWRGRDPGGEERRWAGLEEGRMGGGGWGEGGAADMHLSPISSNALHNSSALSLLPRLRTIRPDAH